MGLLLCNAKHLQLIRNKKHENICTAQKVLYSPVLSFFQIDRVVGSVRVTYFFLLQVSIVIFDGRQMKIILTQISSCIKVFNLKKSGAPIFHVNVMFLVGYYNKFAVVRRQILGQLFLETIGSIIILFALSIDST